MPDLTQGNKEGEQTHVKCEMYVYESADLAVCRATKAGPPDLQLFVCLQVRVSFIVDVGVRTHHLHQCLCKGEADIS